MVQRVSGGRVRRCLRSFTVPSSRAARRTGRTGVNSRTVSAPSPSYSQSNREAYEAANDALQSSCGLLIAVWDGQPSNGKGGTGDVVEAAGSRDIPVVVVWPDGAQRQ